MLTIRPTRITDETIYNDFEVRSGGLGLAS
jgi:hypothetical protein